MTACPQSLVPRAPERACKLCGMLLWRRRRQRPRQCLNQPHRRCLKSNVLGMMKRRFNFSRLGQINISGFQQFSKKNRCFYITTVFLLHNPCLGGWRWWPFRKWGLPWYQRCYNHRIADPDCEPRGWEQYFARQGERTYLATPTAQCILWTWKIW